jgi:hypothetical protein
MITPAQKARFDELMKLLDGKIDVERPEQNSEGKFKVWLRPGCEDALPLLEELIALTGADFIAEGEVH